MKKLAPSVGSGHDRHTSATARSVAVGSPSPNQTTFRLWTCAAATFASTGQSGVSPARIRASASAANSARQSIHRPDPWPATPQHRANTPQTGTFGTSIVIALRLRSFIIAVPIRNEKRLREHAQPREYHTAVRLAGLDEPSPAEEENNKQPLSWFALGLTIQFKDLFGAVHRSRLPGEVNLQAQPASLTPLHDNHHSPVAAPGHLLNGIIDTEDLLAGQHAFKFSTKKRLCQSIPLRFGVTP